MAEKGYKVNFEANVDTFNKALDSAIKKANDFGKEMSDTNAKIKKDMIDSANEVKNNSNQVTTSNNKIKKSSNEKANSISNDLKNESKALSDNTKTVNNNKDNKLKSDSLKKESSKKTKKEMVEDLSDFNNKIKTTDDVISKSASNQTEKDTIKKSSSKILAENVYEDFKKMQEASNTFTKEYVVDSEKVIDSDKKESDSLKNTTESSSESLKNRASSHKSFTSILKNYTQTITSLFSKQKEDENTTSENSKSNNEKRKNHVKDYVRVVKDSYSQAKKDTSSLADNTVNLTKKVALLATTALGLSSVKDLVANAFGKADIVKSTEKAISQLTGSAELGAKAMEDISNAVQGTPVGVQDLTGAVKGFVAAGGDLDIIPEMLQATLDASYAVGNGKESIDYISNAFKGLQASGIASLEDINRMVDQNIPAIKILANAYGLSVDEMKKQISAGAVSSTDAIKILIKGIEEGTDGVAGSTTAMAGQVQNASDTIQGASSNIKASLVNTLMKSVNNYYEDIVIKLNSIKDYLKEHSDEWSVMITNIVDNVIKFAIAFYNESLVIISSAKEMFNNVKPFFNFVLNLFGDKDVDQMEKFGKMFARLVAVMLTIHTVKSINNTVQSVLAPLKILNKTAILTTNSILKMAGSEKTITSAFSLISLGFKKLTAVMMANPFIFLATVILSVVTALYILYKKNEEFRDAVNRIWKDIVNMFKNAFEKIIGFGKKTLEFLSFGLFDFNKNLKVTTEHNQILTRKGESVDLQDTSSNHFSLFNLESRRSNLESRRFNLESRSKVSDFSVSKADTAFSSVSSQKSPLKNILSNFKESKSSQDIIINIEGNVDSKETVNYLISKIKKELISDMENDNRNLGII